ncbi:unnamed protein product, partial [marine sediment metagenome]
MSTPPEPKPHAVNHPGVDVVPGNGAKRPSWRKLRARQFQFLVDLCILSAAFVFSYQLRFDFYIPPNLIMAMLVQLPMVLVLQLSAMHLFGIHTFAWRYIGMADTTAFIKAAWWSFLPMILLRLLLPDELAAWRIPLSISFLTTIGGFGGIHAARVLRRVVYEVYEKKLRDKVAGNGRSKPVLLVGAGQAGIMAAKEIKGRGDMHL